MYEPALSDSEIKKSLHILFQRNFIFLYILYLRMTLRVITFGNKISIIIFSQVSNCIQEFRTVVFSLQRQFSSSQVIYPTNFFTFKKCKNMIIDKFQTHHLIRFTSKISWNSLFFLPINVQSSLKRK